MYIEATDGEDDATLFHDYGHEVYYRRMLEAAIFYPYGSGNAAIVLHLVFLLM
jgi:hypothetical protein